jgi:hypothetical protein
MPPVGKGRGRGGGRGFRGGYSYSSQPSAPLAPRGLPLPPEAEGSRVWRLYFAADEGSGSVDSSLFGDAEAPAVGGQSDRASILARIDHFLNVKNIVRAACLNDPMNVIISGHTLHLSWSDLVARVESDPSVEPPFSQFDCTPRPQLVLDCLAFLAHEVRRGRCEAQVHASAHHGALSPQDLLNLCPHAADDPAHTAERLAARRLRVRIYERSGSQSLLATPICDLRSDKIGRLVKVMTADDR